MIMKKNRSRLSLVLALGLLFSLMAPTVALATSGAGFASIGQSYGQAKCG